MGKYTDIQNAIVEKYRIKLDTNSKCWQRTHAHVRERRVCKWKQANSFASTFTLLHEVGHIENHRARDRRAEDEYHATVWAIDRCIKYGLEIPENVLKEYQDYIDMEVDRGKRRGGSCYPRMDLKAYYDSAKEFNR